MKKTVITTVLLGLFSTTVLGVVANAVDPTTDATIQFKVNDDEKGFLIKPNPEAEDASDFSYLKPEPGHFTTGPLRIQYVPDLNFGLMKSLSSQKIIAYAKPMSYAPATELPEGVTNANITAGHMVPFVQVSDNRGYSNEEFIQNNGWNLTVTATEFKTKAENGNAAHTLTGAKIYLKGSTLATTNGATADAKKLVDGFVVDPNDAESGVIPLSGSGSLTVLETKKELTANTNGHQVSNVFANNYKKSDTPTATEDLQSIQFVKPANVAPQVGKDYKATLTWTLTEGL